MEGISIIVPVYNEEKILAANVRRLAKFLSGMRVRYEIIISDNGSTDRTAEIARRLVAEHPKRVRLVTLAKRGVGYAFKAAVKAARYDKLVSIDADLTTDLGFIRDCVGLLDKNSIVIGSKHAGRQSRPVLRKILSLGFILMTRVTLGIILNDHSIGAKGYRRFDILPYLKEIDRGSFYVTMLVYRMAESGKRFTEVPVLCRDTRRSKFSLWREVLYRFRSLVTFWLREKLEYAA